MWFIYFAWFLEICDTSAFFFSLPLKVGKNSNRSITHLPSYCESLVSFRCYMRSFMRKKIRFLSFYLLYAYENDFFFAWMPSYNNRTTKVTRNDLMSGWLLCFPSLLLMTMTLSSTRLFHIKTCWRIRNYIYFCQSFDCRSKKEMSWNYLKVVFVFHLLGKL
jgi:hypothetical protein